MLEQLFINWSVNPEILSIGPLSLRWYSLLFVSGFILGWRLLSVAFSLFKEKGIFNTEVSNAFRKEILEKGGMEDEAVIYRNFRGHDPQPEALMEKLGLVK